MANEITLHQVNEAGAYNYELIGNISTQAKGAGCFKPAVAGASLTKVEGRFEHQGTPIDELRCKVYSNDSTSNEPDTLLATSTNSLDPSGYTLETWNFDGSLTLEKDTIYWAVFERTGTPSNTNLWRWAYAVVQNQILTDECLKYDASTEEWSAHPSGQIYSFDVRGESSSMEELVNYDYEYDANYNLLYSTTYWGIAQKFKTPQNVNGNNYMIDVVSCGVGSFSSPTSNAVIEFHIGSASSLDLSGNTTRVGQASNPLGPPMGTAYYVTQARHWTWDTANRPQLSPNTEYWIVILPESTLSSGGWRIGQDNTDPKGDGYSCYRVSSTGILTSTGANEVHDNLFVIGSQRGSIGSDKIIPWTIVDFDSYPVNSDFILPYRLITAVDSDNILRWKIIEDSIWGLPYNILETVNSNNDLKWKILLEAQYDHVLPWNILVEQGFILPWVLRPYITNEWIFQIPIWMATDTVLRWGLNYEIGKDFVFKWIIDSQVWKDIALKYHIKVETDHVLLIPLLQRVSVDHIIGNHLLNDVPVDHILRFNIREFNQIDADNKLRYVLEGRPRIYKITFE